MLWTSFWCFYSGVELEQVNVSWVHAFLWPMANNIRITFFGKEVAARRSFVRATFTLSHNKRKAFPVCICISSFSKFFELWNYLISYRVEFYE